MSRPVSGPARETPADSGPLAHSPRPFLKWAGGKAKLAPAILEQAPRSFGRYHEPFAGGAAVFFAFVAAGRMPGGRLTDANPELVECFTVVRDRVDHLIDALEPLAGAYLP